MEKLTEFVSKSFDPSKNALSVQYLAQSAARPDPTRSSPGVLGLSEAELVSAHQELRMSVPHLSLGLPLDLARYHGLSSSTLPYSLPFILAPRQQLPKLTSPEETFPASPSESQSPKRLRRDSSSHEDPNNMDEEEVDIDVETTEAGAGGGGGGGGGGNSLKSKDEEEENSIDLSVKKETCCKISSAQDSLNNNSKCPSAVEDQVTDDEGGSATKDSDDEEKKLKKTAGKLHYSSIINNYLICTIIRHILFWQSFIMHQYRFIEVNTPVECNLQINMHKVHFNLVMA